MDYISIILELTVVLLSILSISLVSRFYERLKIKWMCGLLVGIISIWSLRAILRLLYSTDMSDRLPMLFWSAIGLIEILLIVIFLIYLTKILKKYVRY